MIIISLSLNASRVFEIAGRYSDFHQYFNLHDGDMLVMMGLMQKYYLHGITKDETCNGARFNLTWRWIQNHDENTCFSPA